MKISVIGGGLAGCEAALQLAARGVKVDLYDIKPSSRTAAHHSSDFGELVCSNSLKSNDVNGNACGLLKQELRLLKSFLIDIGDKCSVPAGSALAVDRNRFSQLITSAIVSNPNITVINREVTTIPDGKVIIASGPLTTHALSDSIAKLTGYDNLSFYDAAAPIVYADSIDMNSAFIASRYNKGTPDYINCPLNKEQYTEFVNELLTAKTAIVKDFEVNQVFEGCMPIEIMASRGIDTLRFGPLKPVGLVDDRTHAKSYAVLQLRKENVNDTLYNLVGFQTHLTFSEQQRVFAIIPALVNAQYARYGVMHRNTFINAPKLITSFYRLINNKNVYIAGQLSGVEGYVESIASGLVAAINAYCDIIGKANVDFGKQTVIGSLGNYLATFNDNFQPINSNYGIMSPIDIKDKKLRKEAYAATALQQIQTTYKEYIYE